MGPGDKVTPRNKVWPWNEVGDRWTFHPASLTCGNALGMNPDANLYTYTYIHIYIYIGQMCIFRERDSERES